MTIDAYHHITVAVHLQYDISELMLVCDIHAHGLTASAYLRHGQQAIFVLIHQIEDLLRVIRAHSSRYLQRSGITKLMERQQKQPPAQYDCV